MIVVVCRLILHLITMFLAEYQCKRYVAPFPNHGKHAVLRFGFPSFAGGPPLAKCVEPQAMTIIRHGRVMNFT